MPRIAVHKLVDPSDEQVESAVRILSNTFQDDVGMSSFSGGSSRVQRDIYRRTIKACLARGEVYVGLVDDEPHGVAALIGPGADWAFHEQDDFTRDLSSYLKEWYTCHYIPVYEELYRAAFTAGQRARRDAWNLKFLAVEPAFQSKGLGRALLGAICQRVQWLGKFGFSYRAVRNFTCKDSAGFPLWCTVRQPGTGSS
ncbi:hypothetical protein GY45DRAFT_1335696 [Cubamyces sp. BRFM 1775]|nr:hypothetical protein GY45DRAFT_1335696 [Cubamyces sp. BRFM 1775]